MRLTFLRTFRDIQELNRTAREPRLGAWLITLLGVGHLLLGAWMVVFPNHRPDPAPVFVVGMVFVALGMVTTRLAGLGAWVRSGPSLITLEVGLSGVTSMEGDGPHHIDWALFSRWYETRNLVVLVGSVNGKRDALAIPKSSCGADECAELRNWLRQGIGAPAYW